MIPVPMVYGGAPPSTATATGTELGDLTWSSTLERLWLWVYSEGVV